MYRVVIQKSENAKESRITDVAMKTEKVYELLGRFTLQYGPPEMTEESHGVFEFFFEKDLGRGDSKSATISFARIGESEKEKKNTSEWRREPTAPIPPPPPSEPNDDRIDELLTKGVIEIAASYYQR